MSKVIKKNVFAGKGAAIQLLALLAPIIGALVAGGVGGAVGLVALVILFFVGSQQSRVFLCGNCKNPLHSAQVTVCPSCKTELR